MASRLTVEITETCAIEDIEATRRAITAMKALGVKVAMDDFGAGHTSFRNLRGLSFDLLKIDGAFVQNLARSADDRFFVRTLVDLAHHLAIPIVAEWVEDAETAELLTSWGVDYFQGNFFGRQALAAAAGDRPHDRERLRRSRQLRSAFLRSGLSICFCISSSCLFISSRSGFRACPARAMPADSGF